MKLKPTTKRPKVFFFLTLHILWSFVRQLFPSGFTSGILCLDWLYFMYNVCLRTWDKFCFDRNYVLFVQITCVRHKFHRIHKFINNCVASSIYLPSLPWHMSFTCGNVYEYGTLLVHIFPYQNFNKPFRLTFPSSLHRLTTSDFNSFWKSDP